MNDRNVNDFSGHINFQEKSPTPRSADVKGQRLASIRFLSLGVAKLMLLSCYGWCFFGAVCKCLLDCYLFLQGMYNLTVLILLKPKGRKGFPRRLRLLSRWYTVAGLKYLPEVMKNKQVQYNLLISTLYTIYIFIYLYDWYPEPLYHLPTLFPLWRSYISGFSSSAVGRFEGVEKRKTLGIVCTCPITCPNLPNTLPTCQ